MNVGIFGITANPPHVGHLRAIEIASKSLDEVWVTPVFKHPFNKGFIEYNKRLEMLKLSLKDYGLPNVILKELDKEYFEKNIDSPTVYSYNLLSYLKSLNTDIKFSLIIGQDNYVPEIWHKFYKHKEIEQEFSLFIVEDFGAHSTEIRNKIKNNEPIYELVTSSVENYININQLYKEVVKCKI